MFGKSLDLDRGIFSEILEDEMYAKGSLSTHMAELLKPQWDMIERHKQIIQKGDINHTSGTESAKYRHLRHCVQHRVLRIARTSNWET